MVALNTLENAVPMGDQQYQAFLNIFALLDSGVGTDL